MCREATKHLLGIIIICLAVLTPVDGYAQQATVGPSGLPLPRFVSIKSAQANVRIGPSRDHKVTWIFVKPGWPVEIIQEFDNWRRIRDAEGAEGWVFHSLLSGARTALVVPWEKSDYQEALREEADDLSKVVAWTEPKVLVRIAECTGAWCRVDVEDYEGWIKQDRLWGVYQDEKIN